MVELLLRDENGNLSYLFIPPKKYSTEYWNRAAVEEGYTILRVRTNVGKKYPVYWSRY